MLIAAGSQLVVVHPFTAEGEGELTVSQGSILTLLEPENEQNAGWLLVKTRDGRSGYVPIDFLKESQGEVAAETSFKQKAASRMSIAMPPAAQQPPPHQAAAAWGGIVAPPPPPAQFSNDPWAQRDSLYGPQIRTPIPAQRRWYYRDLFGDLQGPFNAAEMRQRVEAKHIQSETFCVMEVGSGAVQKHEEKKLRDLFPGMDAAFLQPPQLTGVAPPKSFWFFQDDAHQEHGPFSADQMRLWFDVEGYFGSRSLVREASMPNFQPLRTFFADPMTCFLVSQSQQMHAAQPSFHEPPSFQIIDPFNTSSQQQQVPSSSRQLLSAALAGNGPPPPAAIGSSKQQQSKSFEEEDEDDTLALFDQVGLMSEEDRKKTAAATPAKTHPVRVYGTPSVWPAWKGVPNFTSTAKSDTFPTILYHFFTRPLNPNAGKILCHITREIDGIGHFSYNKFVLYLENETGPQPTAVGLRHAGPMSTTFDIKLLTNGRVDDTKTALTIAKMEVNFMGTEFLLHNAVPGHQGKAKDLACIMYEANRMGKGGPRKMKIGIPDVEEGKPEFKQFVHGATGSASMKSCLQSINASNMVAMLNKPPKWNAAKGAYSLDFGGRVTRASVKNFQLVDAIHDPDHNNVILQHGRVAQDKFTMDVQHPMSLLQAFAVCLSSLHQKKAVD